MRTEEQSRKIGQIITRAWTDEAFKRKLLDNAGAVLREEGVELPEGVEVRVVENTDKVSYLVLPRPPAQVELSDEELEKVAGGVLLPEERKKTSGDPLFIIP